MTARARLPLAAGALAHDGRTIAAVATAPGRGALAMVRISGAEARAISLRLLAPPPSVPRHATHTLVRDASGATIDDVIATLYLAPHSSTGEDLVEVSTHGGLVAPTAVLAAAIEAGARQAEPGEFTRRAVLNGKLDLLQAEAIGDLVNARSRTAHRVALRQLDGGLSRRLADLRRQLLGLEALLAYDIDFPEEDDGPVPRARIEQATTGLLAALRALLATAARGTLVHDGALVVLAGPPNAGKSSLFNALLGEARAIVTDIPGTTRDAIEALLDLPGYPLRLVDTAGLRETTDGLERLGIETSERYLARAAVVLACGDTRAALAAAVSAARAQTSAEIIATFTKRDLMVQDDQPADDGRGDAEVTTVRVSAQTGEGLAELLRAVEARLDLVHGTLDPDAPALTAARHRAAVSLAEVELEAFERAWREDSLPPSIAAIHLRGAADALGELIGTVQVDDVLDVLFASFCVGK